MNGTNPTDMNRNNASVTIFSLACLALLGGSVATAHAQTASVTPIVVDTPMVHDPVMAQENGTYYLFCTGHGITQMTSTDRHHWTISPEGVLPANAIPAWTHDSVPGFETHIWAPDVFRYRNRWYLAYSCSTFGKNTSAIGLLSSPTLAGAQWKDEGCIVASRGDRDDWNAIDPNFILDEKGRPWLTWGSFWDGIQLVQLDKKTLHVKRGAKPVTIARRHAVGDTNVEPNPTSRFAGTNAVEAPFIMRHGDYFYLFVSWDYCCRGSLSNYRVAVGRSRSVAGPYVDRTGKPMLEGGGTLVAEGDKHEFEAMGHCAAYTFGGEDIFLCHGYSVAKGGASILVQRPIAWDAEGWPVLGGSCQRKAGNCQGQGSCCQGHGGCCQSQK